MHAWKDGWINGERKRERKRENERKNERERERESLKSHCLSDSRICARNKALESNKPET